MLITPCKRMRCNSSQDHLSGGVNQYLPMPGISAIFTGSVVVPGIDGQRYFLSGEPVDQGAFAGVPPAEVPIWSVLTIILGNTCL